LPTYKVKELSESVARGSLTSAPYGMFLTTRSSIVTFTCIQKYRLALHSQIKKKCKKHNSPTVYVGELTSWNLTMQKLQQ